MDNESLLNENCNLIRNSGFTVRKFERIEELFVVNEGETHTFGNERELNLAQKSADESKASPNGCSTCPVTECKARATVIVNEGKKSYSPALRTSFSK